jgi:hypothetical protein
VGRVALTDALVAVALVARVRVGAAGQLTLRVLVVGLADTAGAGLAEGRAVALPVLRRGAVTGGVIRSVGVRAVATEVAVRGRLRVGVGLLRRAVAVIARSRSHR